ncbi:hypothetical protein Q1695_012706 [Nippostrongylus brasiliensis]|nr:hypothetical protein Q1695_012706 [Nippostrongylus brasiliensis]
MLLGCTVLMVLLVRTINSACEPSLLENCARCCSMLFPTSDCDPSEVLRVKINGDGVLGAIWEKTIVAAVVRPGCLLELWDTRNRTGRHRTFGLDGYEVYQFDRYGFEKSASSAKCTCIEK